MLNNEHGGTVRLHSYANETKGRNARFAAFTDSAANITAEELVWRCRPHRWLVARAMRAA